jgi:hypothetical protein
MDWWQKSELFIVNGSSAYVFFRPAAFADDGIGAATPGTNQNRPAHVGVAVGRHLFYCAG